jgi:outer membrane immunogenic protein
VLLDRVAAGDGAKGGLAGGVIGFNRQINRIVYGVEFSWDWANLNGNQAHVLAPTLSTTTHVDWISTFTGRIGYLATDRTLLYVKGGYAILDENYRINSGGVLATTRPDGTRRAFVVGGGLEFAFGANLSAKAEYNYLGFREHTYEFTRIAGAPLAGLVEGWEGRQQTHIVKVGLNWHFMPGPVIARY